MIKTRLRRVQRGGGASLADAWFVSTALRGCDGARAHWRCIHWLQSWRNRAGGTFVMIYSVRRIISFAVF